MAAQVCLDCTTVYTVGAPQCPHCASPHGVEQGGPDDPATRVDAGDPGVETPARRKAGRVPAPTPDSTGTETPDA